MDTHAVALTAPPGDIHKGAPAVGFGTMPDIDAQNVEALISTEVAIGADFIRGG
jgi:hypothetical protein